MIDIPLAARHDNSGNRRFPDILICKDCNDYEAILIRHAGIRHLARLFSLAVTNDPQTNELGYIVSLCPPVAHLAHPDPTLEQLALVRKCYEQYAQINPDHQLKNAHRKSTPEEAAILTLMMRMFSEIPGSTYTRLSRYMHVVHRAKQIKPFRYMSDPAPAINQAIDDLITQELLIQTPDDDGGKTGPKVMWLSFAPTKPKQPEDPEP